jgi:hypothetical protein
MKYILKDKKPVKCNDLLAWADAFEHSDNQVAFDRIDDIQISTVFLGVDHAHGQSGPPMLFETMVYGGELDKQTERCSTWDEAEVMHKKMLQRVQDSLS